MDKTLIVTLVVKFLNHNVECEYCEKEDVETNVPIVNGFYNIPQCFCEKCNTQLSVDVKS